MVCQSGSKKKLRCLKTFMEIISIGLYLAIFCYWTVTAFQKYRSQPISTNFEYRFGDDDKGNITFPVLTFCQRVTIPSCTEDRGQFLNYDQALECIKTLNNVSQFENAINVDNVVLRKYTVTYFFANEHHHLLLLYFQ